MEVCKMKTVTELFNKHFRGTDYEGQFEDALAERDKEWQDKIEEKIKELMPDSLPDDITQYYEWRATIGILQELLEETK